MTYRVQHTPGKRESPAGAPSGALAADGRNINWSVLLGYRAWKIEPYVFSEMFVCSPTQPTLTEVWAPGGGVNVYLRPNVIVKTSWTHPLFWKDNDPQAIASQQNFHTFTAMLVWAFRPGRVSCSRTRWRHRWQGARGTGAPGCGRRPIQRFRPSECPGVPADGLNRNPLGRYC
ncbi:MAG TPA: hypothetical protein VJ801_03950 [Polyangia bacterium]|nr:hypothetical protein [Polyangia bacterium]